MPKRLASAITPPATKRPLLQREHQDEVSDHDAAGAGVDSDDDTLDNILAATIALDAASPAKQLQRFSLSTRPTEEQVVDFDTALRIVPPESKRMHTVGTRMVITGLVNEGFMPNVAMTCCEEGCFALVAGTNSAGLFQCNKQHAQGMKAAKTAVKDAKWRVHVYARSDSPSSEHKALKLDHNSVTNMLAGDGSFAADTLASPYTFIKALPNTWHSELQRQLIAEAPVLVWLRATMKEGQPAATAGDNLSRWDANDPTSNAAIDPCWRAVVGMYPQEHA